MVLDEKLTEELLAAQPDTDFRPADVPPGQAAYVVFTSGTTGEPKGVIGTHAALGAYADDHLDAVLRPAAARLGRPLRIAHAWSFAFDAAWQRFDAAWGANEQFTGHHAAEVVLDVLGHDPSPEVRKLVVEAYLGANGQVQTELTPNVADTLRTLKAAGVRPLLLSAVSGDGIQAALRAIATAVEKAKAEKEDVVPSDKEEAWRS